MFSYRSDKMGFFATLILIGIVVATLIATIVLCIVGGWESMGPWLKFTWGLAWVLSIGTVLVRVYVFHLGRKKQANAVPREPPEEGVLQGGVNLGVTDEPGDQQHRGVDRTPQEHQPGHK